MAETGRTPISELLWRAWGALGVSSWVGQVDAVVDPEVLIVLTAELGDERLYLETVDWGILHASLLMPGRLRRLAARAGVEQRVGAWIATVASLSSSVAWKMNAHAPLEDFEPSRKSHSFIGTDAARPGIAALRWRSVLGTSVRSEVLRSFHPVVRGRVSSLASSDIIDDVGATKTQVNHVLDDLVDAGLVEREGSVRRRRYVPVVTARDPLANALWSSWQTYPHAPWKAAIELLPLLAHAMEPADASAKPVSAAIDAHRAFTQALPLLQGFDRELAGPVATGAAQLVAAEVRDRAWAASEAVAGMLAGGDDPRSHRHDQM